MALVNLVVSLAFLLTLVGLQYFFLCWYQRTQKNTWELVAEGVYEKVQTRSAPISIKGFTNFILMMMVVDTVFFQDGTTCRAMGITQDLPDPGTRIKIYKNGMAEFRVERVL